MSVLASLSRRAKRLASQIAAQQQRDETVERLSQDRANTLSLAGMPPDPWQAEVLRSHSLRLLFLCSRQSGKTLTASAIGLATALTQPDSLTLILSPTLRQSGELFRAKLLRLWRKLGAPLRARPPTQLSLELSNGARIVSLPQNEEGIRGYSGVNLLIIDEAARVADELYYAVRPMLSTSQGRLVALSTPFGQQGWFYEAWTGPEEWHRVRVVASQCPRIPADFLRDERKALGKRWYEMEYECSFLALASGLLDPADVDAALACPGLSADLLT